MSTQLETALEGLNEMTIAQRRAVLGLSESELRIVRNLNGLLGRVEELEAELERLRESIEAVPVEGVNRWCIEIGCTEEVPVTGGKCKQHQATKGDSI